MILRWASGLYRTAGNYLVAPGYGLQMTVSPLNLAVLATSSASGDSVTASGAGDGAAAGGGLYGDATPGGGVG